jgi:hypothetical protein
MKSNSNFKKAFIWALVVGTLYLIVSITVMITQYIMLKMEQVKLEKILDAKELREFTFYYHTHEGQPAVHKRIYVASQKEEVALSKYLIEDQNSSGAWPYFDRVDSISMATLDTASIGHNFPCKMIVMKWNEKIIWKEHN